jgi:hypothetical protein
MNARSRTIASVALVVIGAVLLFAGTATFYARNQVLQEEKFGDRATAALRDSDIRHLVSREIVVN